MNLGILEEPTELLLTNLTNGKSAKCLVRPNVEGGSPDFIEPYDFLEWGRKTGCRNMIIQYWSGKCADETAPFVAVTRQARSMVGLGIYRNQMSCDGHWNEFARLDDKLLFYAVEHIDIDMPKYGEHPNMIPRKGK